MPALQKRSHEEELSMLRGHIWPPFSSIGTTLPLVKQQSPQLKLIFIYLFGYIWSSFDISLFFFNLKQQFLTAKCNTEGLNILRSVFSLSLLV